MHFGNFVSKCRFFFHIIRQRTLARDLPSSSHSSIFHAIYTQFFFSVNYFSLRFFHHNFFHSFFCFAFALHQISLLHVRKKSENKPKETSLNSTLQIHFMSHWFTLFLPNIQNFAGTHFIFDDACGFTRTTVLHLHFHCSLVHILFQFQLIFRSTVNIGDVILLL